ncbi:hypothetical protein TVAG_092130 [Trichomonas vaginalis G3]|uniref:DUF4200 domain-containing protein n=1 Tax=Trichomonas vaginalis (strain ATCC PRA-98 / G3) TaxID=412133 RepID=A2FWH0_TRIV3|nr:DUF4200 domain family [Trichomonas vaginalis G3]EAX90740.1 hypothetical protein TVAG_092130 [Trichomonas vaginalis G3]KAI5515759.1 DUF4200 domain family [Trichomonas vaginalis G3]|eukprot:XP_001303670.1 hypothetical protein [Trichomonas vaginalis G3]
MSDMDHTFLTRQTKQKSSFEQKYLERFGGTSENSLALPSLSPQLIKKKQEMEKTNAELEEARTKFEAWKTNFQRKKKELDEKQHTLDIQKANLRTFTEHHSGELEKARRREEEEKQRAKEIEAELEQLAVEEEELKKQNDELKAKLEQLQPCADYLQAVANKSRNFENVEAILNRHQSLAATRQEYVEKFQELMSRFGTEEQELNKELETKRALLIDRTMQLNDGLARVNQAKKLNQYNKTSLYKDIQRVEAKNTELAEIKSAIQTIYNRALEKSNQASQHSKTEKAPSIESMLQFIENRFKDLSGILNDPNIEYITAAPRRGIVIQQAV